VTASAFEGRRIAATSAEIWAVLSDIEQAPAWNPAWEEIEFVSEQREGVGTVFRARSEAGTSGEFEVVQWQPGERIAFAPRPSPDDDDGDFWISIQQHTVFLRSAGEGLTDVSMEARARSHGLRGWVVSKFIWPGYQRRGLADVLGTLASMFEEPEAEAEEYEGEPES
jgi:uncharacterized protein YndB with AHSA1/START domain